MSELEKKNTNLVLVLVLYGCLLIIAFVAGAIKFYTLPEFVATPPDLPQPPKLRIMLLVDGPFDDNGWSQAHVTGFTEAISQVGADAEIHDNVNNDQCINYIDQFSSRGGDLVIAPSKTFNECLNSAVKHYHNIIFVGLIHNELTPAPNLLTFSSKEYQLRYITGLIAATFSDSDNFGFIASFREPETVRAVNAYTLGLRSIKPKAKLYLVNTEDLYNTQVQAKALDLIRHKAPDINVLAYHTSSKFIDKYCDLNDLKCISTTVAHDQHYPKSKLSSIEWSWRVFYKTLFTRMMHNTVRNVMNDNNELWLDLHYGTVRLGKGKYLQSVQLRNLVDQKLGEFLLDSYYVFAGPIVDNEGILRVPEGENIPRNDLLYGIDWYVDGVVEIPYEH